MGIKLSYSNLKMSLRILKKYPVEILCIKNFIEFEEKISSWWIFWQNSD